MKKPKSSGRQYSIKLEDDMVEFALESTNIDSVSVAVRALIRKAMKEAQVRHAASKARRTI